MKQSSIRQARARRNRAHLVGWLVEWLDGWWADGWMVGWLDGWMVGWLVRWVDGWMVDHLTAPPQFVKAGGGMD